MSVVAKCGDDGAQGCAASPFGNGVVAMQYMEICGCPYAKAGNKWLKYLQVAVECGYR